MTVRGMNILLAFAVLVTAFAVSFIILGPFDASSDASPGFCDTADSPSPLSQGPAPDQPRMPGPQGLYPSGPEGDRRVIMVPGGGPDRIDRILDFERMKAGKDMMESEGRQVLILDDGRHDPVFDAVRQVMGEGSFVTEIGQDDETVCSDDLKGELEDDVFLLDIADALEDIDNVTVQIIRSIVDYRQNVSSEMALRQMAYVWKDDADTDPKDDEVELVDDDENDLPASEPDAPTGPYCDTGSDVPCLMHVYRYSGGAVDGPAL